MPMFAPRVTLAGQDRTSFLLFFFATTMNVFDRDPTRVARDKLSALSEIFFVDTRRISVEHKRVVHKHGYLDTYTRTRTHIYIYIYIHTE